MYVKENRQVQKAWAMILMKNTHSDFDMEKIIHLDQLELV